MKIVDVNELSSASTITADICIIGAGAAGITLAAELDGSAQTVCLIESGGYGPDEETQALYDVEIAGHPVRENFMSRARYFGGTCNIWAGRSMRLTAVDLAPRDWITHSGWPLAFDELARYYPRAERVLRLPAWDRVARLVEPPRMSATERQLFDTPELRPNLSTWAKKPMRFASVYRKQLQRSRNVTTYLNGNVTGLRLNDAGNRVEDCSVHSLDGKALQVTAGRFVLACGGLETARLLLASRAVQPHGIGNQFDNVGRYFMEHPRAVYGTVKLTQPQKLPSMLGLPLADGMAQVGVQFSEATQSRERLLNTYLTFERHWSDQAAQAYQSFVHSMKILLRKGYAGERFSWSGANLATVPELIYLLAPRELMPHALYSAAKRLRQALSRGVRDLIVVNYCEQMPKPQSRVYLGNRRDRFGMPMLVLDWRITPEETQSMMRLHAVVETSLRRSGLGTLEHPVEPFSDRQYTDASHHLGTARMSADPRDGVVDEQCTVHGVANLFVAGSAVFPTSGHANPTLTIVALAIRLAERLKRAGA